MLALREWLYWFVSINWTPEAVTAAATAVLAVLTLVLAGGTLGLWFATRGLVRDAEDANRRQLRAYISPKQVHCVAMLNGKTRAVEEWVFYPVWENGGSTPPHWLYMNSNWNHFTPDIPDDFDFPGLSTDNAILAFMGSKSTTWGGGCEIPVERLIAANQGKCRIYMWAAVEYSDVFDSKKRYRTEFCIEIKVAGNPTLNQDGDGQPLVPFTYPNHRKHNGADEECLYQPKTAAGQRPAQRS